MNYSLKKPLGVVATSLLMAACGGSAVPQGKVVEAKSSVSAAEAVGAQDEPKASLHLKLATDGIVEAEKLIAEEKNEEAAAALDRAKADADLALAMTREAKTRASAEEAAARVNELRAENGGQS